MANILNSFGTTFEKYTLSNIRTIFHAMANTNSFGQTLFCCNVSISDTFKISINMKLHLNKNHSAGCMFCFNKINLNYTE